MGFASIETTPVPTCALCGRAGRVLHANLSDPLFGAPGRWTLKTCTDETCGLVWLDPRPAPQSLERVYEGYYTHTAVGATEDVISWITRAHRALSWVMGVARERRRLDSMLLDRQHQGKLLEVGCGDGKRLARLKAKGWDVLGQEVDAKAAASATSRSVDVLVGELPSLDLPPASFDAVVMNHVIEHVADPVTLLKECNRLLRPGGTLVCTTPNVESLGHRWFGSAWHGIDSPRHLFLFTMSTLESIAERAGFATIRCWTSAANAEVVLRASRDIARGRGPASHNPGWSTKLFGLAVQLVASAWRWFAHGSGEELVLTAHRPHDGDDPAARNHVR